MAFLSVNPDSTLLASNCFPVLTEERGLREKAAAFLPVATCGAALLLLVGIVFASSTRLGDEPLSLAESGSENRLPAAPEFAGISHWLNSDPISLSDLRGSVVLVDFWTYSCVNCLRTIPQLKAWQDLYGNDGLKIVGVHTPEFQFEKDPLNVQLAADTQGVTWPIALDNDYITWDNFRNNFWPTKYLIDHRGRLRYYRIGEGNYQTFEEEIRALLLEAGRDLSDYPSTVPMEHLPDSRYEEAVDKHVTRELYAGYARGKYEREYNGLGYVNHPEYYAGPSRILELEAPRYLQPDQLYFQGSWRNEDQRALHATAVTGFQDYMALVYSARTVNVVFSREGERPVKVRVKLDGQYLTTGNRGADVTIAPDGESYLLVDESRMYQVVRSPEYVQRRKLELSVNARGLGVYAFTFGVFAVGP